jgi:hypothetical protein
MIIRNLSQWTGDYVSAGVTRIEMDLRNPNDFDLMMRLAIAGPTGPGGPGGTGDTYATQAITIPADDAWHPVEFGIEPDDFTHVGGSPPNIQAALADVSEFRILHNPSTSFIGAVVNGMFFVDNITALGPSAGLPGDYNGDTAVDSIDYTLWRDTLGSDTNLAADGNNNGIIDSGDYDVWKMNFGGAGSLASNVSVPEPTTVLLVASGFFLVRLSSRQTFYD